MNVKKNVMLWAVVFALALPLIISGIAGAAAVTAYDGTSQRGMFVADGAKSSGTGTSTVYTNPNDGYCVKGLKLDGTMDVIAGITNARDCVAYTTGLTSMTAVDSTATYTNSTLCSTTTFPDGRLTWSAVHQKCFDTSACTVQGATNNDGAKHTYSTSVCINPATGAGISRVDLDNTAKMCTSKGGVLADGLNGRQYGACTAYGWRYANRDYTTGELPTLGTKGVPASANLGFCYASMNVTTAATNTASTCPSIYNDNTNGAYWYFGSDGSTKYQYQAAYDAGLGWSNSGSGATFKCINAYAQKGYMNADVKDIYGTTVTAANGSYQDLTAYDEGECVAKGFTWDNWIPKSKATVVTNATTTGPDGVVVKLDALTLPKNGGGNFYGSTGAVCLKCHSDQSRSYQERNKPGFINSGHKTAGDDADKSYALAGDAWGYKGVGCTVCHSTARGSRENDINTNNAAGDLRTASGHNTIVYGSQVNQTCFACHGTMPASASANPAANIPVSAGDFANTSKGLAPISNQFLNSPHGQYAATTATAAAQKGALMPKSNYASTFVGMICRSGTEVTDAANATATGNYVDRTSNIIKTAGSNTLYGKSTLATCSTITNGQGLGLATNGVWNAVTSKCYDTNACTAAGKTWDAVSLRCVETQATCEAKGSDFEWSATGLKSGIPSTITASGAGCIYKGIGNGSIITTYYSGGAKNIGFNDLTTSATCSAAGGYWTKEGTQSTSDSASGKVVSTVSTDSQGNCMTCHDIHWGINDTTPGAEPFRRECQTCHVEPETKSNSASGAPQVVVANISHPTGLNTPFDTLKFVNSCEVCHMPKAATGGSAAHLWRINTSATYSTIGATAVNLDGSNQAWVDIDMACGQCHGGSGGSGATHNSAPYIGKQALSSLAKDIHQAKPKARFTWAADSSTDYKIIFTSNSICPTGDTCSYAWTFGTGEGSGTGATTSHVYAGPTARTARLTVTADGAGTTNSYSLSVTPKYTGGSGVVVSAVTLTQVGRHVDISYTVSGGIGTKTALVLWGDGTSSKPTGTITGTASHDYSGVNTYLGSVTVTDSGLSGGLYKTTASQPFAVATSPMTLSGLITKGSITPFQGVTVVLRQGAVTKKMSLTAVNGRFTISNVTPGTYTLYPSKVGYTFTPASMVVSATTASADFTTP